MSALIACEARRTHTTRTARYRRRGDRDDAASYVATVDRKPSKRVAIVDPGSTVSQAKQPVADRTSSTWYSADDPNLDRYGGGTKGWSCLIFRAFRAAGAGLDDEKFSDVDHCGNQDGIQFIMFG